MSWFDKVLNKDPNSQMQLSPYRDDFPDFEEEQRKEEARRKQKQLEIAQSALSASERPEDRYVQNPKTGEWTDRKLRRTFFMLWGHHPHETDPYKPMGP